MKEEKEYLTVKEASFWATNYFKRTVTPANILYLLRYGRVSKTGCNGSTQILKSDLSKYYTSLKTCKETNWKKKLGQDINWELSFDNLKESDTTKHVHKLHPYKGKFIPQLVEYFLDTHTDKLKVNRYFTKGDIVLDPFCGSGTTLVQSNELGLNAIGIDVSSFNSFISNCKVFDYNIEKLESEIKKVTIQLYNKVISSKTIEFEKDLIENLKQFNDKYFSSLNLKSQLAKNFSARSENVYKIEKQFLTVYKTLVSKYKIEFNAKNPNTFLEKWYFKNIRKELWFTYSKIEKIKDTNTKKILTLILSRTMRSCRATTHSDLATLVEPILTTYYCAKHNKLCKPQFSILKWWRTYSKDTVRRLKEFKKLKTDTYQYCLTGDSKLMNIESNISKLNQNSFFKVLKARKFAGVFTSPPYIGLIDYHKQHEYAYELFGFKRKDALEIGSLLKGHSVTAKKNYIKDMSDVLSNCKKYLQYDYNIFLVANDKHNLYPEIAKKAGIKIINQFKRPVLNRTEKDRTVYSETIFHLKED
jgi:hypothetical protein